jgi:hypothetical protein
MPSREAGVALEAAVVKAGAPDPRCGMRGARDSGTCGRQARRAVAERINVANLQRRSRLYLRSGRSDGAERIWRRRRGRSRCQRECPNRRRERHFEGFATDDGQTRDAALGGSPIV